MHHSFWFDTDLGSFIFPGFNVTTTLGLVATCVGLASLAVIYEGMKILQIKLRKMTVTSVLNEEGQSSERLSLLTRISRRRAEANNLTTNSYWLKWMLEICHWSFHTTLGYLLMLAVMSFNGYIGIALIIGSGMGYWIFGPTLIELNFAKFVPKRTVVKCEPSCADPTTSTERRDSTLSVISNQLVTEVDVDVH